MLLLLLVRMMILILSLLKLWRGRCWRRLLWSVEELREGLRAEIAGHNVAYPVSHCLLRSTRSLLDLEYGLWWKEREQLVDSKIRDQITQPFITNPASRKLFIQALQDG